MVDNSTPLSSLLVVFLLCKIYVIYDVYDTVLQQRVSRGCAPCDENVA